MNKCSKKFLNKKGDGLSSVIIAIVFIIITLLIVPAFRGMQKNNSLSTKAISKGSIDMVNGGLTDSGNSASYDLNTDSWTTESTTSFE